MPPPEPYLQITVVLPVCLHLDDRNFTCEWEGMTVELRTQHIASEQETWAGRARNMEVRSDEFSHFRFTSVTMMVPIPPTHGEMDDAQVLEKYDRVFFGVLNQFMASCREALNRRGLKSFHDYNQFVRPVISTIVGPANPEQRQMAMFPFGGTALVTFLPIRHEDEHRRIQELMTQGIPLHLAFLSDAKGYLYHHDAIHALLSAVIALEVKVSETIRQVARVKNVDEDSIKQFIRDVGLTGNIKTTLKLLAPEGTELPGEDVFGVCKGAITVRNAIMHEGRRTVDLGQVGQWIPHIEEMIRFCEHLD